MTPGYVTLTSGHGKEVSQSLFLTCDTSPTHRAPAGSGRLRFRLVPVPRSLSIMSPRTIANRDVSLVYASFNAISERRSSCDSKTPLNCVQEQRSNASQETAAPIPSELFLLLMKEPASEDFYLSNSCRSPLFYIPMSEIGVY
jgi:hypothetical protein